MPAGGGWVEGDASFVGENPPSGAVITYYQRERHIYGPLTLEVLGPDGKVIDTIPATRRRGINRVTWGMRVKPPRVPRAAQVAFNASQGPRVLPGTYTLRLTKGTDVVEGKLTIGLDRRAPYTAADRKAELDATMRAHALFGEMSGVCDRIDAARATAQARAGALPKADALAGKVGGLAKRLEELKKKVVATKEGGAITGEERIREHLDILYGALTAWEGRPARYQVERIDALRRELKDVADAFEGLAKQEIAPLNQELEKRKLDPIPTAVPAAAHAEMVPDSEAEQRLAAGLRCVRDHDRCEVEREVATDTQ
jgi:hypothetical protein